MDNIVNEIYNIENKAEEIINEAIATKNSMAQNLDTILSSIDEELESIADAKIKEFSDECQQESLRKIDSIKEYYKSLNEQLDSDFKENKDKYCNQIFDNIIKG